MNKHTYWYLISACVTLSAGLLYYALHTNVLIIAPYHSSYTPTPVTTISKQSPLFFYKHSTWNQEIVPLLIPEHKADALLCVAQRWLVLAQEEEIMRKKISIEHAFITQDGVGYLSCDQSFFEPAQATREKFLLVQGLIRSLDAARLGLNKFFILVQNKPMPDDHLDFSVPWSCQAYSMPL